MLSASGSEVINYRCFAAMLIELCPSTVVVKSGAELASSLAYEWHKRAPGGAACFSLLPK